MSNAPIALVRPPRWGWLPIAIQTALLGVLAAWLGCGLPLGIPGQWAWEVHPKPVPAWGLARALIVGAEIVGLCWLGLWRLRRRQRSVAGVLAGLVGLTFALQLSVASLAPQAAFGLIAGTASSVATEYFGVAAGVQDPWAYCRTYAETQREGHHVATHPPGAVLAYRLCLQLRDSPLFPGEAFDALTEQLVGAPREQIAAAVGSYPSTTLAPQQVGAALLCCAIFGLCAALTLLPLYWLASRVASRSTALVVCCLFALSPAPVLFFQGLDAPILLLAATALALAHAAVTRQSTGLGALCGLTLGLMSSVTFGVTAALATIAAVAGVLVFRLAPAERPRAWKAIAGGALVWLACVLVLHVLCDGKLHVIFAQAMAAHRKLTWEGMARGYITWVGLNVVEFAVFLGLPALVAVAAQAIRGGWRGRPAPELIGLVGVLVLLALNASGSVRGEVGRVWLFLMPPLIVWAGHWVRRRLRDAPAVAVTTLALSLVQVLLLGWLLTPVVLPY